MSATKMSSETTVQAPASETAAQKLEVVILSVSDAERSKQFYASLGWREDADFILSEDLRILQFTPPGSRRRSSSAPGSPRPPPGPARPACWPSTTSKQRAPSSSSAAPASPRCSTAWRSAPTPRSRAGRGSGA